MKQYRVVFQTEDGNWHPDEEIFKSRAQAEGLLKDMECHYRQFPGDKTPQKIQEREVSPWSDV